jgi:hypothetical protein
MTIATWQILQWDPEFMGQIVQTSHITMDYVMSAPCRHDNDTDEHHDGGGGVMSPLPSQEPQGSPLRI